MGRFEVNRIERRRCMSRQKALLCLFAALITMAPACKDEIPPPPMEEEAEVDTAKPAIKPIEMDPRHNITFNADRTVTIPNLILVIQNSPAMGDAYGLTLTCSRTAIDGSRLVFGSVETAPSLEELIKDNIRFAAGPMLNPTGNGVFTSTTVYQPKFTSMKINSLDKAEARGILSGDFYRFSLATPLAKPTILKAEASFSAAVVRK